ncbi:MAG TPA: O-antigen ligase family protein [Kiritimatiellia bacterium]|nr:O-antigen ligase family protein [Kiritimatiellia bacterium]HMP34680.1 O-antigen ligase family protein [Kiritimatiellia bacterium]
MSESRLDRWVGGCLLLTALLLPLSLVLVQPVVYLGSVLAIAAWWRTPRAARPRYGFGPYILVFLAFVVVTSLAGIRPSTSIGKWNRFLVLALAWSVPWMVSRLPREAGQVWILKMAGMFMIGIGFKAAYDLVRVPVLVSMDVPLFLAGNMRDPQFYMVGLCLVAGLVLGGAWSMRYPPTAAALLFSAAGLLIHFKRGAWTATLGGLVVIALVSRRWKPVVWSAAVLAVVLLSPAVRERVGQIGREFDIERGGRMLLWTEVGPALIAEHPFGVGWKAVKHEDFLAVSDRVEPRLNHLHNNLMQVTLELGWLGVLAWTAWMVAIGRTAWRACRPAAGVAADPVRAGLGLGVLGAFAAMMFNGLVEYNFGDSEIFMMLMVLMGWAAALGLLEAKPRDPAVSP